MKAKLLATLLATPILFGQVLDKNKTKSEIAADLGRGQYQSAIDQAQLALDIYESNDIKKGDMAIGEFYYLMGRAQLSSKKYTAAIVNFEKCANEFPSNDIGKNRYEYSSLVYLGEAYSKNKQYSLAVDSYRRYLDNSDKDSERQRSFILKTLHTKMADAYILNKDYYNAFLALDQAFKGQKKYGTEAYSFAAAIYNFSTNYGGNKDDSTQLFELLLNNRAALKLNSSNYTNAAPYYAGSIGSFLNNEDFGLVTLLCGLLPDNEAIIKDFEVILPVSGNKGYTIVGSSRLYKSTIEKSIKTIQNKIKSSNGSTEIARLYRSFSLSNAGLDNIAYYATLDLFNDFPKSERRKDYIKRLISLTSSTNRPEESKKYSELLLKEFPNSGDIDIAIKTRISNLYKKKDHKGIIAYIDETIADNLVEETDDVYGFMVFFKASSQQKQQNYLESIQTFEKYLELFPTGEYSANSDFNIGLNYILNSDFVTAEKTLKRFVETYSDASEPALYPDALNSYAKAIASQPNRNEEAYEAFINVATQYPSLLVAAKANLEAGVLAHKLKKTEEAISRLEETIEVAEDYQDEGTAIRAYQFLTKFTSKDADKAITLFDEFYAKYPNNARYTPGVIITAAPILANNGRESDAISALENAIKLAIESSTTQVSPNLPTALTSYSSLFLRNNTPDQLKDKILAFDYSRRNKSVELTALISVVKTFSNKKLELQSQKQSSANVEKTLRELFSEITTKYTPTDSDNQSLNLIGNYLLDAGSYDNASKYFNEGLNRKNNPYLIDSQYGLAKTLEGQGETKNALNTYSELASNESAGSFIREESLYKKATLALSSGEDEIFHEAVLDYTSSKSPWKKYATELRFQRASKLDQEGKVDNAIIEYGQIWRATFDIPLYTLQSNIRWMELLWERNLITKRDKNGRATGPGVDDRVAAYRGGKIFSEGFVEGTAESGVPANLQSEWQSLQDLVKQYQKSADIKKAIKDHIIQN